MKQFIFSRICKYFMVACSAALFDFVITTLLFRSHWGILSANILGNVGGMIFQYCVLSKTVFNVKINARSFSIHLATFFAGLLLSNSVIWIFYTQIQVGYWLSKVASMGIPFFFTYNLRVLMNRYSDQQSKAVEKV